MKEKQNPYNQSTSLVEVINISKNDTVVANYVEMADTSAKRRKGLLGYSSLDQNQGIYIVPCECVHTFFMKFIIDVAFIASDGLVLAVQHGLKPNRISKLIFRAEGVLELEAGRLQETDTNIGDINYFYKGS